MKPVVATFLFCVCSVAFAFADTPPDNRLILVAFLSVFPFVVAFSFIIFIFYRNQREAGFRQKEAEMKHKIAEVEMKALRAQINPHFIFNCLNSIHRFMDASRTVEAGQYLTKFSNLVRVVLENSMHSEVQLHEDIFALQLYIEMEQLRMDHYFDYVLDIDKTINDRKTLVPPLILQPFVENAIWHGLNNKPSQGKLFISIHRFGDMLKYVVQDDGVKVSSKDDSKLQENIKKKSLGISLTRERLDIINEGRDTKANFLITEILDDNKNYGGTRVELWLPYEEE